MTKDSKNSVIMDVQPLLVESGFPHFLSLENRFQAMTSLVLHAVILSRKAEVDQLMEGLGPLLQRIKNHPEKFEPLFVAGACEPPLSEDLFSIVDYDDVDERMKEYFTRYVREAGNPCNLDFKNYFSSVGV
jgi:hypothetical protein